MNRPISWPKWPSVWKTISVVPKTSNGPFNPMDRFRYFKADPYWSLDRNRDSRGLFPNPRLEQPILFEGGITASPGVACGPAFPIESTVDMLQFPPGAVLVARDPLPQWAALLNNAVAVITDQGSLTGHLAAVAREFKIPALMGMQTVFQNIHRGDLITVDANNRTIYAGRAEPLLAQSSKKSNPMKGSPVYRSLENILAFVAPLNLTDPEGDNFRPEGCRTLHDIIRFAHEMSLRELFDNKKEVTFSENRQKN